MFSDGNQSPNTILGRVCISARKKLQFQLQRHSEDPTRVNLWPWKGLGRVLNIYLGFIDCTLEHLTFFASNSWLSNRKLNMQPAVSWDGRGSMQNHSWGRCPVLVGPFPSRLSVPEQGDVLHPKDCKEAASTGTSGTSTEGEAGAKGRNGPNGPILPVLQFEC